MSSWWCALHGAGGMRIQAPEGLRVLREVADDHGPLLVADEIATGFGRTGRRFAVEHAGVVPDVLCVGKALAGGHLSPATVVVSRHVDRELPGGTGDLACVTRSVPAQVLARTTGLPVAAMPGDEQLTRWSLDGPALFRGRPDPGEQVRLAGTSAEFWRWPVEVVDTVRTDPATVFAALAAAGVDVPPAALPGVLPPHRRPGHHGTAHQHGAPPSPGRRPDLDRRGLHRCLEDGLARAESTWMVEETSRALPHARPTAGAEEAGCVALLSVAAPPAVPVAPAARTSGTPVAGSAP